MICDKMKIKEKNMPWLAQLLTFTRMLSRGLILYFNQCDQILEYKVTQ